MTGTVAAGLLLTIGSGCRPVESAADRCRRSNAFGRASRSLQGAANPVADSLEEARCDDIERQEYLEARDRKRDAQQQKAEAARGSAERERMDREIDAQLAAIRRSPKVPELGATTAEARVMCERQRGRFKESGDTVTCRVGRPPVFVCVVEAPSATAEAARLIRCDGYYEGGELGAFRDSLAQKIGPPERETVGDEGFRVFWWAQGTVIVTMYAAGVRTTVMRASLSPAPP